MTSRPTTPDLDRRSVLLRGGAVAAGVIGAGVATTALTAAPAAAASGAFTALTPFRCYDSRNDTFGKLTYGQAVDLQANTDAGGATKLPSSATAVTYNLTVTSTESRGFLAVYPGNVTSVGALSTLNWVQAGVDLANGGVVALGSSPYSGAASLIVYLGGWTNARTHFLLDITGWYA